MTLMYTGIDEAGYGPMLGPLCVASASLCVDNWSSGDPAPDLWGLLENAVCKNKKDSKQRIAVADSKKLKLANSSVTKHPLVHLERAVLCFLSLKHEQLPTTDIQLFEMLGAKLEDHPWYLGDPIPLPLANQPEMIRIDANMLRTQSRRVGVQLHDLRVRVIGESEFNETYLKNHSKAAATEAALIEHIQRVSIESECHTHTRIVCDRQSGRTRYSNLFGRLFPGIETQEESVRASRYAQGDAFGIMLTPGADDAFFPVSLASLAAKLVRELAMLRFNRFWASRIPELKPTAGYVQDARRWLDDTRDVVSDDQRSQMVRLA